MTLYVGLKTKYNQLPQAPDQVSFQNNTIEFIPRASGQKLVSTW